MCEFGGNHGPSPGLVITRRLNVILADGDTLSKEARGEQKLPILAETRRTRKTRGEVFRMVGGEQRRKERGV